MKTPQAIPSLIKRYGVTVRHYKRPLPDETSPWKTSSLPQEDMVEMKGLIQHLRADQSEGLPEGGLRAVLILMVGRGQDNPKPGDDFIIDANRWRATTILPHSSTRSLRLLEVMVTSRGEGSHD